VNSSLAFVLVARAVIGSDLTAAETPNIIFIMADDLGYGDLGCYGQKEIQTPNIDRLAEQGMRFTQCYAGSTVCAPSRSVLMTGQHTGHTTVRGNFGKHGVKGLGGGSGRVPLNADDVTVAEVLKKSGYTTGMTGKWGLGEPNTTGHPNAQGFDEWFGYLNQRRAHSYYPDYLWLNERKFPLPGNTGGKQLQYTHDLMTDFALLFVKKNYKKPFFLYVPYTVPHAKYEIPNVAPYADREWSASAKVHAAMITRMDRDIGTLMGLIAELGIDEKTIVFFCSDNGAAQRWDGVFDSSGPLKGSKRAMYEGGIRTPMAVRWPGKIEAGAVDDTVWYFADVLPTLADLAHAEPPDNIDGVSVLPTLLGKPRDLSDRFLYWEFFERGFQQAVRWGDYKAVRPKVGGPLELYDLSKDIGETNDIAADNPHVVAKIEAYLEIARTESTNWPVKLKN
jgi:arylsulfatase A-like enzyme